MLSPSTMTMKNLTLMTCRTLVSRYVGGLTRLSQRSRTNQRDECRRSYSERSPSITLTTTEPFCPRRAFMYVPASDMKKVEKAAKLGADCVVVDCEDGVAVNMKQTARENVHDLLNSDLSFGRSELSVRVNDLGTGLAEEDLDAALTARRLPRMVNLPKVEREEEMDWYVDRIRSKLPPNQDSPLSLTIMIETALGFTNMPRILERGTGLSDDKVRLEGVVFGYDDFAASIGCVRSPEISEMLGVRQLFVVYAKAYQLQAIDSVFTDFRDDEGLRKQSLEGFSFGFTGKQVIHPNQIPIVHQCFTPSSERIDWAKQLVTEFDQHQKTGKGVFSFRGKSVDMPVYLQAKSIVAMVQSIQNS